MATTNSYPLSVSGGTTGLTFDGKKAVTVSSVYPNSPALNIASLAGATYNDGKKDVVVKAGAITEINAANAQAGLEIIGAGSSKTVAVTLSSGGKVSGGSGADKFYGSKGADTFILGAGNDQIGDNKTKVTTQLYGAGDVISIEGTTFDKLTFADDVKKKTVTITALNGNKNVKYTVFKDDVATQLTINDSVGTHYYGTGSAAVLDTNKGTDLKITGNDNTTVNVATIAAGAKNINATALDNVFVIGNGVANNISVSGASTVYGGYKSDPTNKTASKQKVATADNLYGPDRSKGGGNDGAVTFYFDSLAGNDNVYNYSGIDNIKIASDIASLNFTNKNVIKDGGAGKDLSITYTKDGKSKLTIKNNTANLVKFDVNGNLQYYGVDVEGGNNVNGNVGLNAKRTALTIGGSISGENNEIGIEGWNHTEYTGNATDTALTTFTQNKLNEIDASAATLNSDAKLTLRGHSTVGSVLRGANGSGQTFMYGGTGADQYYGGKGMDIFHVNIAQTGNATSKTYTAVGKDVISNVGAGDLIMLDGYTSTLHSVEVSDKGIVTFTDDSKDQKANSITVKTFKNDKVPVVVVDEYGKILAVNSTNGTSAPIGLTLNKNGITTGEKFTGEYESSTYVKGALVDTMTGNISGDVNAALGLNGNEATIDAADYGGAVKAITAKEVGASLDSLYIKGNADSKNTITLPAITKDRAKAYRSIKDEPLKVTVEGGTAADTFIGNGSDTNVAITYVIDAANGGKDVIQNYNPDKDSIVLTGLPASLSNSASVEAAAKAASVDSYDYLNSAIRNMITDKGTDVVINFDKKNSLTIQKGATKSITFMIDDSDCNVFYGMTLPKGLEYDSKRTAITADASLGSYTMVQDHERFSGLIDLSDGGYYDGVKTVDLSKASLTPDVAVTIDYPITEVIGNFNANELTAAKSGSILFGGAVLGKTFNNKEVKKGTADKLYGGEGDDMFVYQAGEGADVVGNTKSKGTLFQNGDTIVLAGLNGASLSRDDVTITDKKTALTFVINGSSDKFTVNKASEDTPVKVILASSLYGSNNKKYDEGWLHVNEGELFVYGMDSTKFNGKINLTSGLLTISEAGIVDYDATNNVTSYLSQSDSSVGAESPLKYAEVDLHNVATGLKNINVTAGSDTAVNIIGDTQQGSALSVTMGAGGGTVGGGYTTIEKTKNGKTELSYKTTKDKFYARTDAVGGTTFVLDKHSGQDNIYNYSAKRGDKLYFADGIADVYVQAVKGGLKFSYDKTGKDNYIIINDSNFNYQYNVNIEADSIAYSSLGGSAASLTGTFNPDGRYYGWDTDAKTITKLSEVLLGGTKRDTHWDYDGTSYIYENGNAKYTLTSSSFRDDDNDQVPDSIAVESDGKLSFNNGYYINPLAIGFHIQGQSAANNSLKAGSVLSINGYEYSLYEADGKTVNGLELTKINNGGGAWVKTGSNEVVYYAMNNNTLDIDGNFENGKANFTLQSVISDANEGQTSITSPLYLDQFSLSGKKIKINAASDTDLANAHIVVPDVVATVAGTAAQYTLDIGTSTNSASVASYQVYDKDGNAANGFEFLRTDLASKAGWTLKTGTDALGSVQASNTGNWAFSSGTTKFYATADNSITAAANGMPDGPTVTTTGNTVAVTFKNGFSVAEKGFSNVGNNYIYYGPATLNDNTSVNANTYAVGESNLFTLSGVEIGAESSEELTAAQKLAKVSFTDNTSSVTIASADALDNITAAHIIFNGEYVKDLGADSVGTFAQYNVAVEDASVNAAYKLYDGDGNADNGFELIRTDLASKAGWTLNTGTSTDERITDKAGNVIQKNGSGFWSFATDTSGVGFTFIVSSDAALAHTADGLPVGISVASVAGIGNTPGGYKIVFDSDSAVGASNIIFDAKTTFGSETKAVHIEGLAEGTAFNVDNDGDIITYKVANLDNDTVNGNELLKIDPASGWSISDGAWTFNNKNIVYQGKEVLASIPSVQFTIDSDARLAIGADGYPIGVTVTAENETKGPLLGTVEKIEFDNSMSSKLMSHVSFATLPTGDREVTSHILGVASGTTTLPSFAMDDANEYYLVDFDDASNGYEFLRKNDHWVRTATNWKFFADSDTALNVTHAADITLGSTFYAAEDGSPRGIKVDHKVSSEIIETVNAAFTDETVTMTVNHSDTYITIGSSLGTIEGENKGLRGQETVELGLGDLTLNGSNLGVNGIHGIHILPSGSDATETFANNATVNVDMGNNELDKYLLVNLDRNSDNGYELLHTNDKGWTFNSWVFGKDSVDVGHDMGSWTYSSDVKIGNMAADSKITFDISAAASLFGDADTIGTPAGVSVAAKDATSELTITVSEAATVAGLRLSHFAFDSLVAEKAFLSNGGIHFDGFKAGDQLSLTRANAEAAGGTETAVYRLEELSGKSDDGLELLYTPDPQYWAVEGIDKRTWTYDNSFIAEVTLDSLANILSNADGTPHGITITGSSDAATISVTTPTDEKTTASSEVLTADVMSITTLYNNQLGTGGTLHIVGFGTDTTLTVNNEKYVVAQLDGDTNNGYELLKVDANWKFYSEDVTPEESTEIKAGTWIYTDSSESSRYTITLSSDAGLVDNGTGKINHVVPANEFGRPVQIAVDSDTNTITLNKGSFNIYSSTAYAEATSTVEADFNGNIILSDNAPVGKNGLHFVGVNSDTKITFDANPNDSSYYFAQLDGDSNNGYELTPWNDNWHRTTDGWSYKDDTTNFNIAMSIASIIDPVERGTNVAEPLVGSPNNVVVSASKTNGNATSDTFTFTGFEGTGATLVSFSNVIAGVDGLHIKGIDAGSEYSYTVAGSGNTTDTKTFVLAELNGDSTNGLELLAKDNYWSVTNEGDNGGVRIWNYNGEGSSVAGNGLTFSIGSDANVGSGLTLINSDTGRPVGVSVETAWADVNSATVKSQTIIFGATDTVNVADATNTIVGLNMVVGASLTADDITKLHFKGFAGSETTDLSSYAYTTDTNKMFTIGGVQYYLADVDNDSNNGYELVKNDDNWHRYATGWYYNDSSHGGQELYFRIDSGTDKALLGAATVDGAYNGKPVGVSVKWTQEGSKVQYNTITIATDATIDLVFSTGTKVENTHIVFDTVNGAANPNATVNIDGLANTPTFQFANFTNNSVDAAGPVTDNGAESTTYYLAHTDGNAANGWEFVRRDDNWTRYDNGWLYTDSSETGMTNFSFFVAVDENEQSKTTKVDVATGTPTGITVDSQTRIISIATDTAKFNGSSAKSAAGDIASRLVFFKDNEIGAYNENDSVSTHVSISGYQGDNNNLTVKLFDMDTSAGFAAISSITPTTVNVSLSDNNTVGAFGYQLRNVDADTSTGVELTWNGWAPTSVGTTYGTAYLYQSGWNTTTNKANNVSFIVAGSAFSTATTVTEGITSTVVKGFNRVKDGVIEFSAGDSSTTVTDFRVENFKVFGSDVTLNGTIAGGSTIKLPAADGQSLLTFTLQNVDKSDDKSLELTNQGWAKTGTGIEEKANQLIYTASGFTFTLSGHSDANLTLDANNDLIPDAFVGANSKPNVTLSNDNASLYLNIGNDAHKTENDWKGLRFAFADVAAAKATSTMVVGVYNSSTAKYDITSSTTVKGTSDGAQDSIVTGSYSFTSIGTANTYQLQWVETTVEAQNSELPATDGWTTSGYDIDDLLGGTTGSSPDTVSELDEILDVKPLAAESAATTFDSDAAFTEVGTDKTIRSLTYGARHKARN